MVFRGIADKIKGKLSNLMFDHFEVYADTLFPFLRIEKETLFPEIPYCIHGIGCDLSLFRIVIVN